MWNWFKNLSGTDPDEPASWWTPEENQHCIDTLVWSEWKKDWLGRTYRNVWSKAKDNIYGKDFIWREYDL